MNKLITFLMAATLAGCAAHRPVPEGYTGPLATVADSGRLEGSTRAQVFAVTEINGKGITDSFLATRYASQGRGASIRMELTERQVPAQAMKLTIRGSHITGAPIQEFADRAMGTFFEVEGVVDFTPAPDKRYRVVGTLSKQESVVWVEDEATKEPVTPKVSSRK